MRGGFRLAPWTFLLIKFVFCFVIFPLIFFIYLVADIVGAVRVLSTASSPPQLRHVAFELPPGRKGVT